MTPMQRSNFRNLYADVLWFGVLAGSTMAFLTVYAARIGASSFQISLLNAGPAVISLLISLPFGRWLEQRSVFQVTFRSSILHRLGYIFLIPIPALLSFSQQSWGIIFITLVMSIPGTLLAIAFNAMFADVVPPDTRAQVVGRRNAILAVSMTVVSLFCGQLLNWIATPLNYQIVFLFGAVGALMSSFHLAKLRTPKETTPRVGKLIDNHARPGMLRFLDAFRAPVGLRFLTRSESRPIWRPELLKSPFGSFMFAYLLFYSFQHAAIPILPLYFVNELHLNDGQIGLGNALFYGTMLAGSLSLNRLTTRVGFRGTLVLGGMVYGMYPLLLGLSTGTGLYLIASLIGGMVWAITNGGLVNRLMERVPENDRPRHMALHNSVLNLGILFGSLIGAALVAWLGLRDALLVDAGLRFFGGLLLLVWG